MHNQIKKGAMGMSFSLCRKSRKKNVKCLMLELESKMIFSLKLILISLTVHYLEVRLVPIGGGIEGVAAVGAGAEGAVGGDGAAGESLKTINYSKILKEVFDTIGVDVSRNADGTLLAKDLFNDSNKVNARNIPELIYALQPFIETCIIIPLCATTKEKFNSYEDWCKWYTDENKQKFPNSSNEIKYCDLLANHITECEI